MLVRALAPLHVCVYRVRVCGTWWYVVCVNEHVADACACSSVAACLRVRGACKEAVGRQKEGKLRFALKSTMAKERDVRLPIMPDKKAGSQTKEAEALSWWILSDHCRIQ